MRPMRPGVALVLAVFVLLALGTTSLGLLFISTQEVWIARSGERATRARWAAESAVQAALADWSTRRHRTLPTGTVVEVVPGSVGAGDGAPGRVTIERLAGPLYLVAATVEDSTGARAAAAALVRGIGVDELWRSFPAALAARAAPVIDTEAEITADAATLPPPPWSGALCPADAAASLASALGSTDRPAFLRAGLDAPDPGGDGTAPEPDEDAPLSRVGPLSLADLRAIADVTVDGAVRPAPRTLGDACDTSAAANWGAPLEPDTPCGGRFPVIYAPDDLVMTGGSGQGLLIIDGDLVLAGDAQFFGAVHVSGTLILRDDAVIRGAAVVAGDAATRLEDAARIEYRACPLWRTFTAASALDQPFAPAGRTWIPMW
ncbi:MAG TPA: hypothetical protein VF212_08000 [Longimicrobiales bacterium]